MSVDSRESAWGNCTSLVALDATAYWVLVRRLGY